GRHRGRVSVAIRSGKLEGAPRRPAPPRDRGGVVGSSAVSLGVVLLLAAPHLAFAHAVPVAMAPAANAVVGESPREITIRFSERVEARASSLQVVDTRGRPVDTEPPRVDPADPWLYRLAVPGLEPAPY